MAWRDFFRGFASCLDLGGSMKPPNPYKGISPEEADRKATESDWNAVGSDMKTAMREFEKKK